ncbi:MAG TPA: GFA family protein [Xanthomonadales bacterium]|nr:GFA family protein [Xanthomonadales bacterium]
MSENTVRGSCLCGAVRFHLELPSKWCAHCHCSMCRKAHGAGYVTWVGFESSRFTLDKGASCLTWFDSSPGASRGFCSTCGSSMLFRSERWAGELHVALACLDDPIDRKPQAHAFHESHVDWMPLDEALKVYNG